MDINLHEVYKPHPDFPQYAISSFGNVYSLITKKNLTIQFDKDNYRYVYLRINNRARRKQVHRLMAQTFISNPNNEPMVLFKTSRKDCPKVKDLFWGNSKDRIKNAYDRGFFPSKRNTIRKERKVITDATINEIIRLLLKGWSYPQISDHLDVSRTVVYKVKHNKYKIKFPENINYFIF